MQVLLDGAVHRAELRSGPAELGFEAVLVDGQELQPGQRLQLDSAHERLHLHFEHSHLLTVSTRQFSFAFTNSDRFLNQRLSLHVPLSELRSHGLLGQTHSAPAVRGPIPHVEGDVDDYVLLDEVEPLFGFSFPYSRFVPPS